jgi:hypothetical protein
VTGDRLINEATRWGLSRRPASDVVADVLNRAPAAVSAARHETDGVPAKLVTLVKTQLKQLRSALSPI